MRAISFYALETQTTAKIFMTQPNRRIWVDATAYLQSTAIAAGLYEITPAPDLRASASSALGDATLSLDGDGQLFFQSPGSGCTGNGTLSTHSAEILNIYDVAVSIAGCSEPFAILNGEFEGLATGEMRAFGDFEFEGWEHWLMAWLTSSDASAPAAVTLEAFRL